MATERVMAMTDRQARNLTGGRKLSHAGTFKKDTLTPMKGGLMSPEETGFYGKGDRWSYFDLPEPILNPVMEDPVRYILDLSRKEIQEIIRGDREFDGKRGGEALKDMLDNINVDRELERARERFKEIPPSKMDEAVRKYRALKSFKKNGVHPSEFMLTRIPVIPPRHRPVKKMQDITLVDDLNHMYKQLFGSIQDYRDTAASDLPEDVKNEARENMYNKYKELVGLTSPQSQKFKEENIGGILQQLFGKGRSKHSMVTRRLLETNVDLAGMGVVAPDPELRLNEVGLPENQAWEVYEPFIMRDMVRKGVPATQAAKSVENRDKRAYESLQKVVKERPVILNRAPTLHKYSLWALEPKLVKGDTVRVPPQIVGPMGMDYDGDNQIASVVLALPKDNYTNQCHNPRGQNKNTYYSTDIVEIRKELNNKEYYSMPYFNAGVAGEENYDFYVVDLEDFPRGDHMYDNKHRSFYDVPGGVKVIAYDERGKQPVLTDVSAWSIHRDREVWLVNLKNKRQIITDDDERAVYGVEKGTYEFLRKRPEEASDMLVPVMKDTSSIYKESFKKYSTDKFRSTHHNINHLKPVINLDSNTGYFAGAFAGDGWVTYNYGELTGAVNFTGIEEEVVDKIEEVIASFYEDKVPGWGRYDGTTSYGKSSRYTMSSIELAEMLKGFIGSGAANKHLPPFWHRTSREFKIGLLSGLLDTDGSICVTHGKKKPQLAVNMGSISLRLLREIQQLLLSLGVYSTIIFSKKTQADNDAWILSISSIGIMTLKDELVCVKKKIEESFNECTPDSTGNNAARTDIIPIDKETAHKLYQKFSELNKQGKVKSGLYSAFYKSKKTGCISRLTFNKAREICPDMEIPEELREIADNTDITWTAVKSIENTGKRETGYDLTVPGYETFMSLDGVILSNTASFSVPVSKAAVQEAREKMTPADNLLSDRDNKPLFTPDQEYAEGLYYASKEPSDNKVVRFPTKQAMREAYNRGEIGVDDPVEIEVEEN